MGKKVTMQLIANELNISKSLVSKALSNMPGVSEETKDKIRMTAITKGYRFVNPYTAPAASAKTGNIAVLLPREDMNDLEYWGKILRGIEEDLGKKSYSMILAGIDISVPAGEGIPSCISDNKVDGALILGFVPLPYITAVMTAGIPVVLVDSQHNQLKLDHVLAENYSGGYDAAKYMLDRGHRHIGFVGDIHYSMTFEERYRGFLAAVRDHEQAETNDKVEICHLINDRAESVIPLSISHMKQVLQKDKYPSAWVCANDPVAFTVLQLLEKANLSCPDDVSLIGFDNVNKCEMISPPLTSIDARKDVMGNRAAEMMFKRMDHPEIRAEHVHLVTQIVERASVLDLRAK